MYFCPERESIIEHKIQDVEPVLKMNQALSDQYGQHHKSAEGVGDLVANIPMVVAEQWRKEGFNILHEDHNAIAKRLNDPDYSKLRVKKGTI